MSWLDSEKPAHKKVFKGVDLSCDGTWKVEYSTDPKGETYSQAGYVVGQNFSLPNFPLVGKGTHIGMRLSTSDASASKMSAAALHFEFADPTR
jgi:hypothetical protein